MTIRASCGHYIDDNCKCPSNDKLTAEELEKILSDPWGCGIAGDIIKFAVLEINERIKSAEEAAREEGVKAGQRSDLMTKVLIARFKDEGFQRGQMEMRERAANVAWDVAKDENFSSDRQHQAGEIAIHIEALAINSGEAKAEKEILYSGQCRHQIPFGQPCSACGR